VTVTDFGYSVCAILVFQLPKHFNYLAFHYFDFDFERTWLRLFKKHVVRTKLDIYGLITLFIVHHDIYWPHRLCNGICCFSAKHSTFRSKRKGCWLGIRI